MDRLKIELEALKGEYRTFKASCDGRDMTDEEIVKANGLLDKIEMKEKQIETETRARELVSEPVRETPGVQVVKDEGDKPFRSLGEQMVAIARASTPGGRIDKRLLGIEARSAETGNSEGVNSEGGFLVQTDFATELIANVYDNSQIFSRCDRRTLTTGANSIEIASVNETSRADGSRSGGVRAYWKTELGSLTASKPAFKNVKLEVNDLTAFWPVSDNLLEDAPFLAQEGSALFAREFDFKIQDGIINGDGAGKPLGVLNAASLVSVSKETGQAAATIVFDNIVKMYSRMYIGSRANAVWFINQDIEPQLFSMSLSVGTGGIPVYMPANGLSQSPYGTLMGRPVVPIEQAATLGTVGDIIFADFSQYIVADKGGMQGASSIHLKFDYTQTVFRWKLRIDGQPRWASALTPYKGSSNTVSPFVALATRA